jgi:dTDP-4-amino-4,6-dideoxygalactose transaminase
MEFIDLNTQQQRIRSLIDERIKSVLNHGQYINGPEVKELEASLASYVGTRHAIGCASGTDALLMALMAYGVGPGDAVFTTPFTFIATAEVICLLGATPIFVDIDPHTFNMDPMKLELAIGALQSKDSSIYPLPPDNSSLSPKGIIPVDLFGLPADYDRINSIARSHNLFVIEDAAQSFGAEYKGKKACSLADIACTSFFPAKPLGCYGDGGMCFTDDDTLAGVLRSIRVHGMGGNKYDNVRIGVNGRLDTLQAAILLAKFEIFPEEVQLRQDVAVRYSSILQGKASDSSNLRLPHIPSNVNSVWAQYSILARDPKHRDSIQQNLKQAGIPTAVYYPKPLHMQQAFASMQNKMGDFPISEDASSRIFSLPMHPYLNRASQERLGALLA